MNPYLITGPALISFSGGRTSAFMLHQILEAHGGTLPGDVVVTFANTGKEREETLRFVHECGTRWGVKVHWLEWRHGKPGFEEVGYNSASRNGEPFAEMIRRKQYLPNATMRYCTTELKVRPMKAYMMSLGHERWVNAVGLRYDEGHRVLKQLARNDEGKERYFVSMPMAKAKHTKRDVMAFWSRQPFDLSLRDYEGNCDMCFLKGREKLAALERENPGMAQWWADMEGIAKCSVPGGARFRKSESYTQLADFARDQTHMFDVLDDEGEYDAECGLLCAAEGEPA